MRQSSSSDAETIQKNNLNVPAHVLLPQDISERRINPTICLSRVLLQRLSSQLRSVSDIGDIVIILSPAVAILKNIRSLLIPFVNDSSLELGYICELLEVVLVDAAQLGGYTINFQTANESALQLIRDISE